jgi:hypothetical protein
VELKVLLVVPRFQRKDFKMSVFASHETAQEVMKRIFMKSADICKTRQQ